MNKFITICTITLISILCNLSIAQSNSWESTNGPFGGEVEAIAFQSNGQVFAGTSTSGIFRSDGAGDIWVPVTSGLPADSGSAFFEKINAIAINSMNWIFTGTSAGIYLSTNNGDNWIPTFVAGVDTFLNLLFIDSADQIFATYFGELYISTDHCSTWQQPATPLFGVSSLNENSQGNLFAANFDGVHLSTDFGNNWIQTSLTFNVSSLTIDNQDNIFAGATGVYRSTDNGSNWALFHILPDSLYQVRFITASQSNQILYAGVSASLSDEGVYRSVDIGATWEKVNQGLADSLNLRYIAVNSSGDVFAGTEHGLFRSTNNGNNWQLFGVPASFIASISFTDGTLFAETFWEFNKGILFRSQDNGEMWERVNEGIENTIVFDIIELSSGNLLCGSLNGVFRSTDGGNSWTIDALPDNSVGVIKFNSAGQIFAGTDEGIYSSTDNGGSWFQSGLISEDIGRLAINSNDDVFAASASNGIFISTDNGGSWSPVGGGITTNSIYDIDIAINNYVFAATGDGVFRSTDNGNSWLVVNNGLSDPESVWVLAVDTLDNVFVGTLGKGVYQSVNIGDNWTQINDGLVNPYIWSLANSPENLLFAGTFGNGVFIKSSPTGIDDENGLVIVKTFNLAQNFPNPFNPSTKIRFTISDFGFTILKVYDLLGREVATLLNEEKPAGIYEVEWDASEFPSGVYFYMLRVKDKFFEVKKMLLLK